MTTAVLPVALPEAQAEPTVAIDFGRLIAERVLYQLGEPRNLFRVDVKHLWRNHFRVNVLVHAAGRTLNKGVEVADSFFVTLADDGLAASPPIARKY